MRVTSNRQNKRTVHGLFILNKSRGISSNLALQKLKRIFQAGKAGHTGSLDRLASGLLPICFGEATKFSHYLLNADKRYLTRLTLGQITTTGDEAGEIKYSRSVDNYSERIEKVLEQFRGSIRQTPPMYSALRRDGTRLYKLAYQGIEIEREPRPIFIHQLTLLNRGPLWLDLDIVCSKGTYIRTLGEDIGEALGCGAHVSTLHRTEVGSLKADSMKTIDDAEAASKSEILDGLLEPMVKILPDWPDIYLSPRLSHHLLQGQTVFYPPSVFGWVRIHSTTGQFLGIGECRDSGKIVPRRLLSANCVEITS